MKGLITSLLDYISVFFSFFNDFVLPSIKEFWSAVGQAALFGGVLGNLGTLYMEPILIGFLGTIIAIIVVKLVLNR